jgi:amino acid transporter
LENLRQEKKPWWIRIYQWPTCYFVGLLLGVIVVVPFYFFDKTTSNFLEPLGVKFFYVGWTLFFGSGFGSGMEKYIERPSPGKTERVVRRLSLISGFILIITAWMGFEKAAESRGKQAVANQLGPAPCRKFFSDFRS